MIDKSDRWKYPEIPFDRMKHSYPDSEPCWNITEAVMEEIYRRAMAGNHKAMQLWLDYALKNAKDETNDDNDDK